MPLVASCSNGHGGLSWPRLLLQSPSAIWGRRGELAMQNLRPRFSEPHSGSRPHFNARGRFLRGPLGDSCPLGLIQRLLLARDCVVQYTTQLSDAIRFLDESSGSLLQHRDYVLLVTEARPNHDRHR